MKSILFLITLIISNNAFSYENIMNLKDEDFSKERDKFLYNLFECEEYSINSKGKENNKLNISIVGVTTRNSVRGKECAVEINMAKEYSQLCFYPMEYITGVQMYYKSYFFETGKEKSKWNRECMYLYN
jgi:hypothetical protein